MEFLKDWKPDIPSIIVTVVLAPLAIFLLKIILRHLKKWGAYLVEGVMSWLSRHVMHSLSSKFSMKRYCRLQLSGGNRYLHVPSRLDVQLDIDSVYVTLILESQTGGKSGYNHWDILSAGNRIRVMGDPGSGKSSLVKRVFRDACKNAMMFPENENLPILVELKTIRLPEGVKEEELGNWFYEYLRGEVSKTAVYGMSECFESYAHSTGLLVLLDGLDEISTTDYPRMQSAIIQLSQELARRSEENILVLTMRTQFHQQVKETLQGDFAHALFLNPFSPSDIYEFLTRWPFKKNATENVTRIYKELTDRPTLREMCSNPLVLSMYVAEDQTASQHIAPESRTEFYSKVTEELIIRRRLKQTGHIGAAVALREQREQILGRLALKHLLDADQPANSLRWEEAIVVVRQVLKCSDAEAEAAFREISKETGLITEERTQQTFRFIHLTFCEFLAAYEAVQGQKDGWMTLLSTHKDFQKLGQPQLRARLLEVIPFAAGLLPRVRREDALAEVAALSDSRLTALCFLETKAYDHPEWFTFTEREEHELLSTPEDKWDEQWLRRLHLFNVVVRDARQSMSHYPGRRDEVDLAEFFKTLVEKQQSSLSTLLSAYAKQDAAAAFRLAEVCNLDLAGNFPEIVIGNCDQVPFYSLVLQQAMQEPERIDLWSCLLSEAALRSTVVARMLMQAAPEPVLEEYIGKRCPGVLRTAKDWRRESTVSGTLYSQLLTIAVNSQINFRQALLLRGLRLIPTSLRQRGRAVVWMSVLTALILVTFFVWYRYAGLSRYYTLMFMIAFLVCSSLIYMLMLSYFLRDRMIKSIVMGRVGPYFTRRGVGALMMQLYRRDKAYDYMRTFIYLREHVIQFDLNEYTIHIPDDFEKLMNTVIKLEQGRRLAE